jgi:predicted methyltransferase
MKLKTLVLAACIGLGSLSTMAMTLVLDNGIRPAADLKRDKTAKPQQIITFSGVKEGMIIADIFGGGGYYTELLSQAVGQKGKVYLHNNQAYLQFVGKELVGRTKGNRLSNVVDYKREAENLGFKDNSLDGIFFVLGYHDMYHKTDSWSIDPDHFINQLNKALKPGGLLLVVDHSAPKGSDNKHSQKLHRIGEDFVKKQLLSKGFEFVKDSQVLRNKNDSRLISPFRPKIRRKTDRFVQLYKKVLKHK